MIVAVTANDASLTRSAEARVRQWCPEAAVEMTMLGDDRPLRDVELLHVPAGEALDLHVARRFAAATAAAPAVGVVADDEGVFLAPPDRARLVRFLEPRKPQDDVSVYATGAVFRQEAGLDRAALVPMPRQLYLGLTQRCNRSCSFCVSRTFHYDLLSIAEVERIIAELDHDLDVIALTGAGEAMIHPQFWDILDLLVERVPNVRLKMNTSGIALVKNAERLLRYPVKNVTVSLNAGTSETYKRYVGAGFKAVLRGIDAIAAARVKAGREDLRLCLSVVLMRDTLVEMPEVVKLAFEHGIEEVQGIYLMVNDNRLADQSPFHARGESNDWLTLTARRAATLGVEASLPPLFDHDEVMTTAQRASLPVSQGQRCVEAWSTAYVRPDGQLVPCPYFERTFGTIRGKTVAEIWRGPEYTSLREGLVTREYWDECRHCCGFNETGHVDDYASHWLGRRAPMRRTSAAGQ